MLGTEKKTESCRTRISPQCVRRSMGSAAVFTYCVARGGQGRPVRRWVERLLDFSSDDPIEQNKNSQQLSSRSLVGDGILDLCEWYIIL